MAFVKEWAVSWGDMLMATLYKITRSARVALPAGPDFPCVQYKSLVYQDSLVNSASTKDCWASWLAKHRDVTALAWFKPRLTLLRMYIGGGSLCISCYWSVHWSPPRPEIMEPTQTPERWPLIFAIRPCARLIPTRGLSPTNPLLLSLTLSFHIPACIILTSDSTQFSWLWRAIKATHPRPHPLSNHLPKAEIKSGDGAQCQGQAKVTAGGHCGVNPKVRLEARVWPFLPLETSIEYMYNLNEMPSSRGLTLENECLYELWPSRSGEIRKKWKTYNERMVSMKTWHKINAELPASARA